MSLLSVKETGFIALLWTARSGSLRVFFGNYLMALTVLHFGLKYYKQQNVVKDDIFMILPGSCPLHRELKVFGDTREIARNHRIVIIIVSILLVENSFVVDNVDCFATLLSFETLARRWNVGCLD